MSVIKLLERLAERLGNNNRVDALASLYEPFLKGSSKFKKESCLDFVKKELFLVREETGLELDPQVVELGASQNDDALRLVAFILAARSSSSDLLLEIELRKREQEDRKMIWWVNSRAKSVECDEEKVQNILQHLGKVTPHFILDIQPEGTTVSGNDDKAVLRRALDEVQAGEIGIAYNNSTFGRFSALLAEFDGILEQPLVQEVSFRREILQECRDIALGLRCKVSMVREAVTSLLSLDQRLNFALIGMHWVLKVARLMLEVSPVWQLLDHMLEWRNRSTGSRDHGPIILRLSDRALNVFSRELVCFLLSASGDPRSELNGFVTAEESGISHCLDCPDRIPIFHICASLGGSVISRRLALLHRFCSLDSFDLLDAGEIHNASSVLTLCEHLERKYIGSFCATLVTSMESWRNFLLYGSWNTVHAHRGASALSPAFEQTLSTCATLIREVSKVRASSIQVYDMHVLLRELEAHFLQSIDYLIWPKLLDAISMASNFDDVSDALHVAKEHLMQIFLLRDDIHFLALDALLRSVESRDVRRFTKSRAFFLKCMRSSEDGMRLLEAIDHNGFYKTL